MNKLCVGLVAACGLATVASAAIIAPGTYQLTNHPFGAVQPPPYGLRLDEMIDVTPGVEDNFTFDFAHPSSNMQLTYDAMANTIRIFGVSYGGRDIGNVFAADAYLGVYTIDFLYNVGVGMVPGDDDLESVGPSNSNFGTITLPGGGPTLNMSDYTGSFPNSFRLGDGDDDMGLQGAPGISGEGWLAVNGDDSGAKDWKFTLIVPAPGAVALLGLGGLVAGRRRSR